MMQTSAPSLLETVQSKPIRFERWLPPALAIFVVQYASDSLNGLACCLRPKTTIIHHRVYLPLDLFHFIYKWQLSRCVWLITYQLIFLWIYYYLSSYSRAVFPHLMHYREDTLTEIWFIWRTIICLFLFLQACYHCMKCFLKEALLQTMNYETL